LFASADLFLELQEILRRPKFAGRLAACGETPDSIMEKYRNACVEIVAGKIAPPKCLRDADDVHVLACAVAAGVDAIVSGDKHLLLLRVFEGIPIINAAEALARLTIVP
jgi:predicted nucleic acid-binding protein